MMYGALTYTFANVDVPGVVILGPAPQAHDQGVIDANQPAGAAATGQPDNCTTLVSCDYNEFDFSVLF